MRPGIAACAGDRHAAATDLGVQHDIAGGRRFRLPRKADDDEDLVYGDLRQQIKGEHDVATERAA
ncbi:hypothetical protein Atai01_79690 [Amycolatopsis taiwanensis]|uniref:Uncharacterized protein n=1 Tax=Amycolatopsis taiwanensis TaxID=342230 RepID=A0A9W6RCD9_9PSEU|nr:hypothetical protein Atai01_79690 [Amycolatopsis taiwanensis]